MSAKVRSSPGAAQRKHAEMFAALGDQTRLSLVAKLCLGRPQSIAQLTEGSAVTRQAISKHLRVLQNVGLVHNTRAGRERLYEFNPEAMDDIKKYLDVVSKQWDDALQRLKSFVEE